MKYSTFANCCCRKAPQVETGIGDLSGQFDSKTRPIGTGDTQSLNLFVLGRLRRVLTSLDIGKSERAGFDLPPLCKILNKLILQLNSNDSKDLKSLVDLLFLYDFLLSRDVF